MPKVLTITEICERAFPYVSCPTKMKEVILKRVSLKIHIERHIESIKEEMEMLCDKKIETFLKGMFDFSAGTVKIGNDNN